MKNPLGVSPSKGYQGSTRGKKKILMTSVRLEPTTSGLDLPLLCRLSYEANRGNEKVRVHVNVVPRSTISTNGGLVGLLEWIATGYYILLYIEVAISFVFGRKRTVNFGNQRL